MMDLVNFEGAKAKVRFLNFKVLAATVLTVASFALTACNPNAATPATGGGEVDPNSTAATVNGKAITMEQVERVIKQQGQGQEKKLSPLQLAQGRLQVLDQLIQQEVMYQKAESEKTVPTDDEVTAELNKQKQASSMSAEEFNKKMTEAGETEASLRETIKKGLAIQKLNEKITSKIDAPNDSEIEAFYNGNKLQFKAKRGAQLAAIVITPQKTSANDTTTTELEAQQKAKECGQRVLASGTDFATVARDCSEDQQTAMQGGDWRYFSEDELKQSFGAGVADYIMNKMNNGQIIPQAIPLEGNLLIIKLQRKQEKDEDQTLETPGVRQQITEFLSSSRKQILNQSYTAIAMDEAKVVNYLAKKVVDNPNELSGARPAGADDADVNANTNSTVNSNVNSAMNSNANAKPVNNAKPMANANMVKPEVKPTAANTANANVKK